MSVCQSPLRILHVLDHSLPVHSGYAFRSQAIVRAQKTRGWVPSVVTSPKHYESWKQPWIANEEVGGIRYHRAVGVAAASRPLQKEFRIMTTLNKRMREVARAEAIEVLHAHSPILNAIPALWVGRQTGLPVVYEIRAPWEDAGLDQGTYGQQSLKYKFVKALETWVCRQVHHVAVLCQGLRNDFIQRGIPAEKLTIIANGVDVSAFQTCAPDTAFATQWGLNGKKIVGFLGSFFHYEGLDLLIEAVARVVRHDPEVVLLLVGGGMAETDLKAQVERLQISQHVIMPGAVAPDRIPGLYALVDVLAYPRHSIRLTEIVTPLKPLEAMAMGKALVASDVGGHHELICDGQTGLLFPAGNVEALASALQRLLQDVGLRRTLEQQGPEWVRRERSWEKTTEGYTEVYERAQARAAKRR
jgi:PEP-CTERM/exosortase A-associated glycosyltransferase